MPAVQRSGQKNWGRVAVHATVAIPFHTRVCTVCIPCIPSWPAGAVMCGQRIEQLVLTNACMLTTTAPCGAMSLPCPWRKPTSLPPLILQDFVDAWRKHEKETVKEKGVVIFDLKYPVSRGDVVANNSVPAL